MGRVSAPKLCVIQGCFFNSAPVKALKPPAQLDGQHLWESQVRQPSELPICTPRAPARRPDCRIASGSSEITVLSLTASMALGTCTYPVFPN